MTHGGPFQPLPFCDSVIPGHRPTLTAQELSGELTAMTIIRRKQTQTTFRKDNDLQSFVVL